MGFQKTQSPPTTAYRQGSGEPVDERVNEILNRLKRDRDTARSARCNRRVIVELDGAPVDVSPEEAAERLERYDTEPGAPSWDDRVAHAAPYLIFGAVASLLFHALSLAAHCD